MNNYKFFNKFQNYFFTNIHGFKSFTDYEINENSFLLFGSITKAFPTTAKKYMFYNDFLKFNKCPSLIRALQHKFINNFSRPRIPQAVFFPTAKKTKSKSEVKSTTDKKSTYIKFNDLIRDTIQQKLFLDSKTYNSVEHTDKIQTLGKHLEAQYERKLKKLILKQ